MKHTPGPWRAQIDPLGKRYGPRMALVSTSEPESVCIDCTGSGASFDESAANARLIAKSPMLLSLLQETLQPGAYGVGSTLASRIEAAIAEVES